MRLPKGKRENGYRGEKMTPVPREKRENGYREEKMMPVPKGKNDKIMYINVKKLESAK